MCLCANIFPFLASNESSFLRLVSGTDDTDVDPTFFFVLSSPNNNLSIVGVVAFIMPAAAVAVDIPTANGADAVWV